jgi:hypothetical protein
MTDRPEALRLANDLEGKDDWRILDLAAATELRRLHHDFEVMKSARNWYKAERDALQADAERYRWLREHCYKPKWPNNDLDRAMHLSFTVSGIWSDNLDPSVLDGCIDTAREVQK